MARTHDKTGRSRRTLSPFIALERYLMACPAWRSLSPVPRCALLELLLIYNGSNNGRLALSARTLATRLGISRATATRALCDLSDCGFIEAVKLGGFSCKLKLATEWRLTMHRCDVTGEPPSKKFMRWQDGKIHFTASLQGQQGFTTGPVDAYAK